MHEKECVISTNRKTATKRHSQSASRPARSLIFLSNHERRAHQILGFRMDENTEHDGVLPVELATRGCFNRKNRSYVPGASKWRPSTRSAIKFYTARVKKIICRTLLLNLPNRSGAGGTKRRVFLVGYRQPLSSLSLPSNPTFTTDATRGRTSQWACRPPMTLRFSVHPLVLLPSLARRWRRRDGGAAITRRVVRRSFGRFYSSPPHDM